MENIERIILYHGSISELNEEMHRRFRAAKTGTFFSEWYNNYLEHHITKFKKELHEKGFEGLANMKTLSIMTYDGNLQYMAEGTPIYEDQLD